MARIGQPDEVPRAILFLCADATSTASRPSTCACPRPRPTGTQGTFESGLRCLRPGGILSSLGVYSGKLEMPYDAFAAGLGDHHVVTTLCPGGKERMRRLMELVRGKRVDLTPLLTHRFKLDDIRDAYALFGERREGVIKVAIRP